MWNGSVDYFVGKTRSELIGSELVCGISDTYQDGDGGEDAGDEDGNGEDDGGGDGDDG